MTLGDARRLLQLRDSAAGTQEIFWTPDLANAIRAALEEVDRLTNLRVVPDAETSLIRKVEQLQAENDRLRAEQSRLLP